MVNEINNLDQSVHTPEHKRPKNDPAPISSRVNIRPSVPRMEQRSVFGEPSGGKLHRQSEKELDLIENES